MGAGPVRNVLCRQIPNRSHDSASAEARREAGDPRQDESRQDNGLSLWQRAHDDVQARGGAAMRAFGLAFVALALSVAPLQAQDQAPQQVQTTHPAKSGGTTDLTTSKCKGVTNVASDSF